MQVSLGQCWYLPVAPHPHGLLLGGQLLADSDTVVGLAGAALSVATLRAAAREHAVTIRGMAHPPLAALVTFVTGDPTALHPCFPLTRTLDPAGLAAFDALVAAVARSPELDLRCFDERWGGVREVPVPADAALLVAGHLAELFFVRRDLLETLLAARPRIWLYTTPRAFERGGGVAGGCYSPAEGAIKLLHARLWEGYASPMPGVAPFLHELGHMLDCLDVARGVLGPATGLYPGLRPADGAVYTADAQRPQKRRAQNVKRRTATQGQHCQQPRPALRSTLYVLRSTFRRPATWSCSCAAPTPSRPRIPRSTPASSPSSARTPGGPGWRISRSMSRRTGSTTRVARARHPTA